MTSKIAIFPGTFDPFTNGHLDIVKKSLKIFDKVIIAIGHNAAKKHLFDSQKRLNWIKSVFENEPRIEVDIYQGLTYQFCKAKGAEFIIRGLRSSIDFEYEKQIAFVNELLNEKILNIFIVSDQNLNSVSSTIVRDLIINNGDFERFIPDKIYSDLKHH
ncbi:MAG: pantetheine-phosphate adenylyltransferase [Bacteroidetes bacterium]|nr:pantetheine-phosphate adenylyltransferase [Bacteroidota bacterium]